jgi:hypothetical protein
MARNWSIGKDNRAQITVDYIVGIGIFIAAFIFVYAFVPTIFTPFHSNSDELTMVADRVAATLVENIFAVNNSSTKLPGILDSKKIHDFATSITADNMLERKRLGLNSNGNANLAYNLEIIIEMENESQPININYNEFPQANNVGQSKRFVIIRRNVSDYYPFLNENFGDVYPGRRAILTVRVW